MYRGKKESEKGGGEGRGQGRTINWVRRMFSKGTSRGLKHWHIST